MSTWLPLEYQPQSTVGSSNTSSINRADALNTITTMLWYIVPPIHLVCGTFGNVMIVVVMRGMRSSQSTACLSVYFTALAVSDQCLLMTIVLWFWVDMVFTWPPSFFHLGLLCKIPKFLWYTTTLTSAWFLVAMTYQRVTSVVTPHRVGVLCTVRRGKVIVTVITVASLVLNLHFLITFTYMPEYRVCMWPWVFQEFMHVFMYLDLCWATIIPFLLLIIGNSILIVQVVQSLQLSRKMRGHLAQHSTARLGGKVYPMTTTLILTSTAFLVLTLPTCVFAVYRPTLGIEIVDEEFQALLKLTETVTLLLWFTVCASNFYLYLLSGSKFREEAKKYLCWHKYHKPSKGVTL